MLFAHPDIYSFPETHFFKLMLGIGEQETVGQRPREFKRRLRFLGYAMMVPFGIVDNRRKRKAWNNLGSLPSFDAATQNKSFFVRRNAKSFVAFVDAACISAGKQIWIEKTPEHLFCTKRIQRYIPDAIFVHLIRNGPDTVASLVDAGRRYPRSWGKESPLLIKLAVRRWNRALRESLLYQEDPRHYIVRYEELVSDPVRTLAGLCTFLRCEFDDNMVKHYSDRGGELIRESEHWKKDAVGPIRNTSNTKFKSIFDTEWQDYILRHIDQF